MCELLRESVLTVNRVVDLIGCSRPAAAKALRVLEAAEVLQLLDKRKKTELSCSKSTWTISAKERSDDRPLKRDALRQSR